MAVPSRCSFRTRSPEDGIASRAPSIRTRAKTFYDVILVNFISGTESLLRRVPSQSEADRLLAELQNRNQQPSNFFYWVARAAGQV